jgi:hypothetical protein
VFDVIFAYPDVKKWRTIDTYSVVIAAGEIELTKAEGHRLAAYVEQGGTLVVADGHLSGEGVKELALPATGDVQETDSYRWLDAEKNDACQRFRFRPITAKPDRALAKSESGKPFCVAIDRGKGRLIYLSLPHGLGINRRAHPVVARLFAHLTRGLMPIEVEGDVEWLVNRTPSGWLVTLLNPAGQPKPQQGIVPTDYRANRAVEIVAQVPIRTARDRLSPDDLQVTRGRVKLTVPAGGVRIVEIK